MYTEQNLTGATADDVAGGLATHVGQPIKKPHVVPPQAAFFDRVVRIHPDDPQSPLEGLGRFNVETYILSLLGIPITKLHTAGLTTAGWLFDSVLPFITIMAFSLITHPGDPNRADRFYAKMRTPVAPTPEEDRREIELSNAQPHRFDDTKIFPNSQWQFTKWTKKDVYGFFGCWVIVALILSFLWGVLSLGS
jgi:hypothetical protein